MYCCVCMPVHVHKCKNEYTAFIMCVEAEDNSEESALAFHLLSCSCHSVYFTATAWELQSNPPVSTSCLDVGVNRIIDDSYPDTTSSSLQVLGSKLKPRDLHCTHFYLLSHPLSPNFTF